MPRKYLLKDHITGISSTELEEGRTEDSASSTSDIERDFKVLWRVSSL